MALVPRGHLGSCHYERSINCHRERSVAICWQWDCRAVHSARLAMTRTATSVELARRLLLSLRSIASDKNRVGVDCRAVYSTRLAMTRSACAFHSNDKSCG